MAGYKVPVFEKGTILTHEMMNALKNNTLDLGRLSYYGYSDGILSGCAVSMSDNTIFVSQGIIIFQQNLYFLSKDMKVTIQPGNGWQYLYFQIGSLWRDKSFVLGEVQLELTTNAGDHIEACSNKIEICRFRLQNGAILRTQYRNFADLNTEFDTINEIYAQWSGFGRVSISNKILRIFAKEAVKESLDDPQDILFIQQILALDGKTLNRNVIEFYISLKLGQTYDEMSNQQIYEGLKAILKDIRHGNSRKSLKTRENHRIVID
ncbi:MAG: hypothetical protein HDR22_01570 [Lachnospiraceae bacterium]|nr:hypothetical protein [Lachnospiraceae bacterium]